MKKGNTVLVQYVWFKLYNRGIFKQNRFNNLRQDVDYQDAEYDLNKVVEISGYLNHEAMAIPLRLGDNHPTINPITGLHAR